MSRYGIHPDCIGLVKHAILADKTWVFVKEEDTTLHLVLMDGKTVFAVWDNNLETVKTFLSTGMAIYTFDIAYNEVKDAARHLEAQGNNMITQKYLKEKSDE